MQNDRGFERVADQFFLARFFDRLADDAPQFEEFIDLLPNEWSRRLPCGSGNNCR